MSDRDKERQKAKIIHKLRWYYLHILQGKHRKLMLYPSYRHYLIWHVKEDADYRNFCHCEFFMTKTVHPGAGVGDQLASWITGYYYAHKLGIQYAHSRLYPDKWENFFAFGSGEQQAAELLHQKGYKKVILPWFDEEKEEEWQLIRRIMASYRRQKVVFFLEQSQVYTAQYGAMDAIRSKFNRRHPLGAEPLLYQPGALHIAVHIRRGDIAKGQITGEEQLTQRWLNNEYYVRVLEQLLPAVADRQPEVYLFSQGKREDFQDLEKLVPLHYCLDMSAAESFLHMVRADILITSKSSFSYKPALLSDGIRICPRNFWHGYPDDEKWILADDNGELRIDDGYFKKSNFL